MKWSDIHAIAEALFDAHPVVEIPKYTINQVSEGSH